jgi:hypothetical protein
MAEKKSLVEEALIQMKSLENVVAENAKGILASTMKEEIGELVKESLNGAESDSDFDVEDNDVKMSFDEQEEEDMDTEISTDIEDMDDNEEDMDDEEEFDFPAMDDEDEFGDEPIDLTNASDEEILKVFKAMGDEDGIIVKKDGNTIDLEDSGADVEYKISLGEQEEESDFMGTEMDEEEEDFDFSFLDDDSEDEDFEEIDTHSKGPSKFAGMMDDEEESEDEFEDDDDELMFEIEMDDELGEQEEEELEPQKMETKEGFKAKGVGMGKPKFNYGKTTGGFKEDMKHGNPTKGTGKPKFEFKEGDDMMGDKKPMMKRPMMKKPMNVKGGETTEASRTLGNGKRWGRNGLDKPKAAPQHLRVESVNNEVKLLREKNEEYRKALNVFRDKLNEVAVFNSNLAYATRLFTEHSTTKQEKINVLRRFDSVESLKESKSLYKTIKDELSSEGNATVVKESLQSKIEKTPSSGSAVNLIESKTYENPQFMRMKDLMSKMNIIK